MYQDGLANIASEDVEYCALHKHSQEYDYSDWTKLKFTGTTGRSNG